MEQNAMIPTKGNLLATKKSLALARMGHELMDRKRNILVREMMGLIDEANALRDTIDETFRDAYAALQRANITLGVVESVVKSTPIEEGLHISLRSVMGVELPTVRLEDTHPRPHYDFSNTNSSFDAAFMGFHDVKLLTVKLAEVENSIFRLATAIKKTQSRANALKNIIIPNLTRADRFITEALEEKEREEFSRMKVIKGVKGRSDTA